MFKSIFQNKKGGMNMATTTRTNFGKRLQSNIGILMTAVLLVTVFFTGPKLTATAAGEVRYGGPVTVNATTGAVTAADGQFSTELRSLDIDAAGNVYVLDGGYVNSAGNIIAREFGNDTMMNGFAVAGLFRVQKFNAAGAFQSKFSVLDPALLGNNTPTQLAVSDSGRVFVLINQANIVREYDAVGAKVADYSIPASQTNLRQANSNFDTNNRHNTGGLYYERWNGTDEYLYAVQNDGTTVWKLNINTGAVSTVTLSQQMDYVAAICVRPNGDIVLQGGLVNTYVDFISDRGDQLHEKASDLLVRFDKNGQWITNYGIGRMDNSSANSKNGDTYRHTVTVDAEGNLYSMSPGNDANMLKLDIDNGTISYHTAEFGGNGDIYSFHGYTVYLAANGSDIYAAITMPTNREGKTKAPVVAKQENNPFSNSPSRPLTSIGLDVTFSTALAYNVSYDLSPVTVNVNVAPKIRATDQIYVEYKVYDYLKNEMADGNLTMELENGVAALAPVSFTPAYYSWYSIVFTVYNQSKSGELIYQRDYFLGVTKDLPGLAALAQGEADGHFEDVASQAFMGLKSLRINTREAGRTPGTLTDESFAGLDEVVNYAIANDIQVLLQFEMKEHCAEDEVKYVAEHFKGKITYYEIINEPDLGQAGLSQQQYVDLLKNMYGWIKGVNPDAQVMGPTTCGINLNYIREFYRLGGGDYTDIISVHDYEGHESLDPAHWEDKMSQLRDVMSRNGDSDKPIWVTEHGMTGIRIGVFLGGAQAVRETLRRDVLERSGVSEDSNYYYYASDRGFAGYPSYLWSSTGPHPAALALRTRFDQLRGTLPTGTIDFGVTGNKQFYGTKYIVSGTEVAVLRTLGDETLNLTVKVSGGSALTYLDSFGNEKSVSISGGKAVLTLTPMPVYARLAPGQTLTVDPIDFGENIALKAAFTYSGDAMESMKKLNNGGLETAHAGSKYSGIWQGLKGEETTYMNIDFNEPATVEKMVIYSARADNAYSTLLDYDIQYKDGDAWKTAKEVRSNLPVSDFVTMFDHYAQTWYMDQNMNTVTLDSPVTAMNFRLVILRTTYGYGADKIAQDAEAMVLSSPNYQTLYLREIEMYGAGGGEITDPQTPVDPPEVPGLEWDYKEGLLPSQVLYYFHDAYIGGEEAVLHFPTVDGASIYMINLYKMDKDSSGKVSVSYLTSFGTGDFDAYIDSMEAKTDYMAQILAFDDSQNFLMASMPLHFKTSTAGKSAEDAKSYME
jgi:hypothetical protein